MYESTTLVPKPFHSKMQVYFSKLTVIQYGVKKAQHFLTDKMASTT